MKFGMRLNKEFDFKHRLGNVIQSLIAIIESLISIISFSFILPSWSIMFAFYRGTKGKHLFYGKNYGKKYKEN